MSQIIILDTHIWFWLVNLEFDRFPVHWQDKINSSDRVGVSSISCFEIALAHKCGKLELPCAADEWFLSALKPMEIELLPITPEIACRAVNLSAIHKDPFDRIIIATTLEHQAHLASVDSQFPNYSELNNYLLSKK